MNVAYVDTSSLVAILFGERGARATARHLESYDEVFSSNLLQAELRAFLVRERVAFDDGILNWVSWVLPDRPLTAQLDRVLAAGYLCGADLWHVACALFLADDPSSLSFVTLDQRQRAVTRELGFRVPTAC